MTPLPLALLPINSSSPLKDLTEPLQKCYITCEFKKNIITEDVGFDVVERWWDLRKSKLFQNRQQAIESIKAQYDYSYNLFSNAGKLHKHNTKRVFIIVLSTDITKAKKKLNTESHGLLLRKCFAIQEYDLKTKKFLDAINVKYDEVTNTFVIKDNNKKTIHNVKTIQKNK